ncbi:MAG: SDR family NAD(P)-dependent oxidoreductase [Rhodospirillales bacterium]
MPHSSPPSPPRYNLQGRVAVVTGASRGIGAAVRRRLLDEGMTVICASRSAPKEPKGPKENDGGGGIWIETDVSDPLSVAALFRGVEAAHGRLDALVNNAGVQIEKSVTETTDDDWERLMGVNMHGVFLCCRAAVPLMAGTGGGAVVNVGSVSARHADPNMALYNASKGFVHALTRAIAVDHGRQGVRCNAVCPGWIMTDMAEAGFNQARDPKAARAAALARHPAGRMGAPEDIANITAWLLSDEAAFASGQMFTLDGAMTAQSPIDPAAF